MAADPNVLRAIYQRAAQVPAAKRQRYLKAALETGLVESGLRNLNYGDADSKGWRQERTSIYPNPTNVRASVNRFFNELAQFDHGQSPGKLAADVQRPAAQFRGRYAQASGQADALMRTGGAPVSGTNRRLQSTTTTTPTHLAFDPVTAQAAQITLPQRPQRQITAPTAPAFAAQAPRSVAPSSATPETQTAQTALAGTQTPAPRFNAGDALEALTTLQQSGGGRATTGGDKVTVPQPGGGGGGAPVTERKGVANFDGKQVAAWIKPILRYARSQGWKGNITSGYRSLADQTRIYNSGVRPAARPGTSNHEFTAFPGGAIDVSDAQTLSNILRRSKYAKTLVYAGGKDPVHFSHPHDGGY